MSSTVPAVRRTGRPGAPGGGQKRLPSLPAPVSEAERLALQSRIRQAATQKAGGAPAAPLRPAAAGGSADPIPPAPAGPPRAPPAAQDARRKRPPPSLHLLPGSSSTSTYESPLPAAAPTSSAPVILGRAGRAGMTRAGTPTRRAPRISAVVGAPSDAAADAALREDSESAGVRAPVMRTLSSGWSKFQNAALPGDRAATPPRSSQCFVDSSPGAIAAGFQESMAAHTERDRSTLLASVHNLSKIARTDKVRWGEVAEAYAIQVREYAEYKQAAKLEELEQHKRDAEEAGSIRRSLGHLDLEEEADEDRSGMQDRYMQLRRALDQKELGVQLSTSGFPDEAEFRLQCCVAEFCEETGYHNRLEHLDGFEARKNRSRRLDSALYFDDNAIPGLVEPVPGEVEDAYVAYAHLATIRYKRAEEHQQQMAVWGSVDEHPGEEASERRKSGWERAEKLYRRDVDLAKEDLRAWIAFLTETRAEVTRRDQKHKCPDKITIVLGSRLLILCARHGHIELAEGLYMVAVEWLDFGIHDVGVFGDSWTVKRLLQVQGRKKKCSNPLAYGAISLLKRLIFLLKRLISY